MPKIGLRKLRETHCLIVGTLKEPKIIVQPSVSKLNRQQQRRVMRAVKKVTPAEVKARLLAIRRSQSHLRIKI